MNSLRSWWTKNSGGAKIVTVLAALLVLQIGLCWTTPFTVVPAYLAVHGPSSDSELGLGLMIWQGILCIVTFLALFVAAVAWAAEGRNSRDSNENEDNDD